MKTKTSRLGDVVNINPESIDNDYPYSEIEYIEISSVGSGTLSGVKRLQIDEAPSRAKRIVRKNDTILSTVRPNRRSFLFIKNPPANLIASTGFAVLRPSNQIDSRYLYYVISHQEFTDYLTNNAKGSAYPAVDVETIERAIIPFPSLHIQEKISTILSSYDDLIENNARRIQLLEEMAQLIYREWFVHYRFPGHEHVKMVDSGTEFGEIPEGWCTKPISDVVEILGGGTPSIKVKEYWEFGHINWYTPSDLTKAGTLFMDESSRKITKLGLKKSSAKLFPSSSVMMTSRATLGVTAINTTPACTNQGFITCVPSDEISNYEIFFWIKQNIEKMISVASGATFKEITKSVFRNMPIVIPPLSIHKLFVQNVSPIFSLILNLQRKNENLHKTRNLLLPKLISGEIDVSELEIEIA